MPWSTSGLRVRLAPLNRFKPSSKIFYWPFQGGTSFVDLLRFCSVLCLLCLSARLFICALWSPAGKGWPLGSSLWCLTVSVSLSHWYPGPGVVLDCIDSWSLHPYLLCLVAYPKEFYRLPFPIYFLYYPIFRSSSVTVHIRTNILWEISEWLQKDWVKNKWVWPGCITITDQPMAPQERNTGIQIARLKSTFSVNS